MSAVRRAAHDPLAVFYKLPPVPNDAFNDQRTFSDGDFFGSLDLSYKPLHRVKTALNHGDLPAARAAILQYFRTRTKPVMTRFHTDPHWSDWGQVTVCMRADALCENKVYQDENTPTAVAGGPSQHGGIDWSQALQIGHEIRRQGSMATLAHAWSLADSPEQKQRYADAFQRWICSYVAAVPFVVPPTFHRETFNEFGGPGHEQLGSCYVLFHWGDILNSALFRTPGALPDDFAFSFLRSFRFLAFQFTRLLGSSWRADNHHLMERGVAPHYLGVQFPEFQRAGEMERYGGLITIRHFDHNVLPDNVGAEHCAAYNYRCLIRYAMPASIARANGRSLLGKAREKRLQDWLEHTAFICAPDGRLVDTGDGEASALYRIAEESGAMFGNAVIKGVLKSLGGDGPVNPAFQARWDKVQPVLPNQPSRIYPFAGHLAMRDGWQRDSMFLHMAIKNQNLYNIHTHWNTYEFTLAARGKRLIGNPTARTYVLPKGLTRGFYFSMDAHNTLIIDDDNLKCHRALANAWGLQPPRIASAHTALNGGKFDYATFTHHGYLPLIHRRDVLFVRGRYVIMTDGITMDFTGLNSVFASEGDIRPHTYRQRIHFEADVSAELGPLPHSVLARDTVSPAGVLIVPEPFEELRSVVGPSEYMQALDHPQFQGYRMADVFRGTIGACFFSTVYHPFTGQAPNVSVTALTPKATPYRNDLFHAIRVDNGQYTDFWFVQRDVTRPRRYRLEQGGTALDTDAACLFVSTQNGNVVDAFQCGGKRSSLNGQVLRTRPRRLTRHV
jgi:hypothetical protein